MSEIENLANSGSAVDAVSDVFGVGGAMGLVPGGAMIGAGVAAAGMMGKAGGGGAWTFDKEQISQVIKDWEALRDDLQDDMRQVYNLKSQDPTMSADDPSGQYVQSIQTGVGAVGDSTQSMLQYVVDFLDKLHAARDGIERQEDANEGSMSV